MQPRYRPIVLLSVVVVGFHFFHQIPKAKYEKEREEKVKSLSRSDVALSRND